MATSHKIPLALVALVGLGLTLLFLVSLRTPQQAIPLLGARENVKLITPKGIVEVVAKIDTGADYSSIDEKLALSLGLEPIGTIAVITAEGRRVRPTTTLKFILDGRTIDAKVSLADRASLSTEMLVGKNDLGGFRIDPSREFLTRPAEETSPLPLSSFGSFNSSGLEKFVVMIPILGAIVVLLRLLVGIRTYGVFAPVVIALTLVNLGVIQGIIIYVFLLAIGGIIQFLVLARLRLPHIAQFSLIMFTLVIALVGVSIVPLGLTITITGAFFPMIITSHLIEQVAENMEERRLADSAPVLVATLGTAMLLAYYGSFLLSLSWSQLWVAFAVSILAAIASGHYLGLRLTEIFRFKFLKKTHVHK